MRTVPSTRSATALRALNAALLIGLGASLAVVAPEMRARHRFGRPALSTVAPAVPPVSAPVEAPRLPEVSIVPALVGGDTVMRVIANNRVGLLNCYRRVLLRDDRIGRAKIRIRGTVRRSGSLGDIEVDAGPRLRAIDPCLRAVLSRWAFPQKREPYPIEFSFVVE